LITLDARTEAEGNHAQTSYALVHRLGSISTSDQAAAKEFYSGLFGWSYNDESIGDGVFYSMATLNGDTVGAIAPQQPEQAAAGVPPHWQMYITVADVDATAKLVEGAGGSLHAPPFDVMDAGRMAVVTDPSGAFFMLWTAKNTIGAARVNEPGAFTWAELIAPPNDKTASFYEKVVGLKLIPVSMGDGTTYNGFTLGHRRTMLGTMHRRCPASLPLEHLFGAADVDASAKVKSWAAPWWSSRSTSPLVSWLISSPGCDVRTRQMAAATINGSCRRRSLPRWNGGSRRRRPQRPERRDPQECGRRAHLLRSGVLKQLRSSAGRP
jgi:predicted enzyme related to lactoylglutathione lyase